MYYIFSIHELSYRQLGGLSGDISVILLSLSLFPGMSKRFHLTDMMRPLISPLMLYRREIGVSSFLFACLHVIWSYVLLYDAGLYYLPLLLSDWIGGLAFAGMMPLFFTSHAIIMRYLGKRWKLIHNMIHVIVWCVFLHIVIKRVSVLSIYFLFVILADASSLGVNFFREMVNARIPGYKA